jgi:hypothetical protein
MEFMPGRELSRRFYFEAVRPLLPSDLPHSAALIGAGSEVLGFDTPMSMDHDWGARVQLFVGEEIPRLEMEAIAAKMPARFLDFPAWIQISPLRNFLFDTLGFDPRVGIAPADWLSVPEQKWLSLTAGEVFHDALGLGPLRERLHYYPVDVWLYQMAAVWSRIGEEEHLVGRAGYAGDELGASLIAARLVRDMMRLAFLFERQYAPYPKWFGSAFNRLTCATELRPKLEAVLKADGWQDRDARLVEAYRVVARLQNATGVTPVRDPEPAPFFGRPFHVIEHHAGFASSLRERIEDPDVRAIAARRAIGGVDVFSDSTDLLADARWYPEVRGFYAHGVPMP